jgi:hypothetical protein
MKAYTEDIKGSSFTMPQNDEKPPDVRNVQQRRLISNVELLNGRILEIGKETVSVQCLMKQLQSEIAGLRHG